MSCGESSISCMLARVPFFFFQAEDGIRDLTVTGVQTCALPILSVAVAGKPRYVFPRIDCALLPVPNTTVEMLAQYLAGRVCKALASSGGVELRARSEERRVGKEGRSRWSPYH